LQFDEIWPSTPQPRQAVSYSHLLAQLPEFILKSTASSAACKPRLDRLRLADACKKSPRGAAPQKVVKGQQEFDD
jgi:hypothetical protein